MYKLYQPLRIFVIAFVVFILCAAPFKQSAYAHAYSAAYTTLTLTKTQTEMTYALDELSVIELVGGDLNGNYMIEQEEFDAMKDKIGTMLKDHVILKIDNEPQAWTQVESFILDRKGDNSKVILKVLYPPISDSSSISLSDDQYVSDVKTNYVNLLTIQYGALKSTSALSGKDRTWIMRMSPEDYASLQTSIGQNGQAGDQQAGQAADQKAEVQQTEGESGAQAHEESTDKSSGWFSFFKLGVNHILSGYDHLLFIFSLLIARQSFKQYATMITAFTVAHSLTLTLMVLGMINVPSQLVEPAIALSICYVAADNMMRTNVSHRWLLTFLFGLIHGMGFADILKEMVIPKHELAVDLISFNLGIEVVQITILAIMLPLLFYFHRWKLSRRAIVAASGIVLLLGAIWLVQRLIA
ncbi:HupE/UreJ family protein [Paenibacillus aestuarii]|uniref:HupE/UreJ family protein n=1 Tax=Paenibacillus aestuarii TaxID=516965 RepID=A0ABW0K2S1_9BACL|nr:HupE/UreJ family protein [Paenibacillus aestuarii]